MTNTTIPDDWTGIPEEVEKIIASRTVRTRGAAIVGKSAVMTDTTRPFRFIDFSREVDLPNARVHAYIRQGIMPPALARAAILAWVKKNRRKSK